MQFPTTPGIHDIETRLASRSAIKGFIDGKLGKPKEVAAGQTLTVSPALIDGAATGAVRPECPTGRPRWRNRNSAGSGATWD